MKTIARIMVISIFMIVLAALPLHAQKSSATFMAAASGEIEGGPQSYTHSITPSTTQVVIRSMPLDLTTLHQIDSGEICFWQSRYEGPLVIDRRKSGEVVAQYWFDGRARDGVGEVRYLLQMEGSFGDPSNWLPAAGTSATFQIDNWKVTAETKGQQKSACSGTGAVSGTTIVVERLN